MFDKEFYPTPYEVLELMEIDCNNKIVLEPSAGKGDIIDYLKSRRAKKVYAYEKNNDLRKIISDKCTVLGSDFFNSTSEDVSHIDLIVMNPPFSNAESHIIQAFKIAPEGCEILALCNYETIKKYYRYREFSRLLDDYGDYVNLGDCFKTAERKTGVEIGLVKLFKPVVSDTEKFEGFFVEQDEEEETGEGIMQYNEIRSIVNRYVGAVKVFDQVSNLTTNLIGLTTDFNIDSFSFKFSYSNEISSKEDFVKMLQKRCWRYVFNKMNIDKYVTTGVMRDINRFVETQQKYPFTMKNIYRMFEIIIGTRQNSLNKALEEVIDNFTKHTHENRFQVEGWKTNSSYMLNKKFIVNWVVKRKYRDDKLELCYNGNKTYLDDLVKVLCNVRGRDYNKFTTLDQFFRQFDGLERNKWYSWAFFEIKVFMKGTMHIKFQKEEDWYYLNKAYGELKGFTLAEKYNPKSTKEKPQKTKEKTSKTEKKTKPKSDFSNQLFKLFTTTEAV